MPAPEPVHSPTAEARTCLNCGEPLLGAIYSLAFTGTMVMMVMMTLWLY